MFLFSQTVTLLVQTNNLRTTVNKYVNCSSSYLSLASGIAWQHYSQMDTKCKSQFYTYIKIRSGKHRRQNGEKNSVLKRYTFLERRQTINKVYSVPDSDTICEEK